jgi:hypothetical protein
MLKHFVLLLFVVGLNKGLAQPSGRVLIHADPRIDLLVKRHGRNSPGAPASQILGYRVQLVFEPERRTIEEARSRFSAQYPNIDTYVVFNAPHFFLKAGDFRTLMEAEKLKENVVSEFPTSFIVKEQVNLPKIDNN